MNKEKLIPKLRFEGFENNEWIPHKLKNIVRFSKGRGYSKNDLLEQGSPIILYGRMYTNYEIIIHNVDTYAKPKENTIYSEGTEVIVPSSGETAEDIARASFVSKKGIILGGDLNIMHLIEEHNPFFLALSISNGDRKKELIRRAQGSSVVHLYNTDLENAVVYFPTLTEQNKIGCFLKKIDEMIQLQKSKVNKVKDIKSAYLSEMFPKEGEKYPKKRFEGFTESWKEFSLEQVAKIRTGYPFNSNEFTKDGKYLVITNGNIQTSLPIVDSSAGNRITMKDPRIVDEYVLNDGDILVTMDGTVGRTAKVIEKNQILAQRVGRLTAYENSEFLYQALQTGSFYKNMSLVGHGGTIKHISLSEIGSYKITMPDSKEQNKVAEFFKNLDNQISIEEEKLSKLEKLKQAYLNDMFI